MNAGANGYTIEYSVLGGTGSIEYAWDASGTYTYIYNEPNGATDTETFQGTVLGEGVLPTSDGGNTNGQDTGGTDTGESSTDFVVTSPAVENGSLLDAFKCEMKSMVDGSEDSIPLSWSGIPEGTGSIAITMHHYPNPSDTDPARANQYLLLWDIDPSVMAIEHAAADDGPWFLGANKDNVGISYTSPCSQDGAGGKEYTITVYALAETPASLPTASSLSVTYPVMLDAIGTVTVLGTAALTFVD